jgi:hypothetical protein
VQLWIQQQKQPWSRFEDAPEVDRIGHARLSVAKYLTRNGLK